MIVLPRIAHREAPSTWCGRPFWRSEHSVTIHKSLAKYGIFGTTVVKSTSESDMRGYFISPREKTNWRIDGTAFARSLKAKWPSAQIDAVTNPASLYQLEWTIDAESPSRIDGTLTKAGHTFHLAGDVRSCAAFAVWLRALVVGAPPLIFYDEGFANDVELTASKTASDISAPFLAP